MNRIEDDRIVFYLKHQQRIEEWAALAKDTSTQADTFLSSLADDIERLTAEFGTGVAMKNWTEGSSWPQLLLTLPGWHIAGTDGDLRMGIGVQWHRTTTLDFTTPNRCANTGVWVHKDLAGGVESSRKLKVAFVGKGLVEQHGLQSNPWWPAYRYEIAQGEFWANLSPYRCQIVESIRFFWTTFAPIIQKTFAG